MTDYESNLEVPDLQNYIAMIFQKKTPHNLTGLEPGSSVRQADVMTASASRIKVVRDAYIH
jgi:hypothetical protein